MSASLSTRETPTSRIRPASAARIAAAGRSPYEMRERRHAGLARLEADVEPGRVEVQDEQAGAAGKMPAEHKGELAGVQRWMKPPAGQAMAPLACAPSHACAVVTCSSLSIDCPPLPQPVCSRPCPQATDAADLPARGRGQRRRAGRPADGRADPAAPGYRVRRRRRSAHGRAGLRQPAPDVRPGGHGPRRGGAAAARDPAAVQRRPWRISGDASRTCS